MVIIFTCQFLIAQEVYTEHTLTAGKNYKPCACKIEQLSWMAGNWQGKDDGVISEEQWARPIAGNMMGMYRMIVKGKPLFYELMLLMQDSAGVKLQLKHFWHPLKGWEHRDSTGVIFPLLKIEGKKAFFDGMTYELISKNELVVYLAESTKSGAVKEEIFRMKINKK
jgi:hypothetical protein